MITKIVKVIDESDMDGESCPWCSDDAAFCVTNIYTVNAEGVADVDHGCVGCVDRVIELRHHGDTDVLVEVATAPMPHELGDSAVAA